jgi:glycerate 2-kinase
VDQNVEDIRDVRRDALDIFLCALQRTQVAASIEQRILFSKSTMTIDGYQYMMDGYTRVMLVSVGKAAGTMAATFLRLAGELAGRIEGLVDGVCEEQLPNRIRVFHGGHPSPNQASLDAAAEALRLLAGATEKDLVVFLISGGGSSMMEQMLSGEITLEEVAATHKALVESGATITEINSVRKHFSAVKGGRLAAAAAPAEQVSIFVSDVPEGALDALASGPTMPDSSTVADVQRIANKYRLAERLPRKVAQLLEAGAMAETPKEGDAAFARSRWVKLLDSLSLEEAAVERAEKLEWTVTVDNTCDDWMAADAAEYLLGRLRLLREENSRVCLLSAGEVTVRVREGVTGRGGRNQHFALLCAQHIAGENIVILSAGSDGVDGNSAAAGAMVDGRTVERASAANYSVARAIEDFDSHGLLSNLGDAIVTGPTGNNLRDLRILLAP